MLWFHKTKWVAQFLTGKMTGNGMNENPENWQCARTLKIFHFHLFFRTWPPRWWWTWRRPPGWWWARPPRLVGQIWSTNPYWLPCNCGKSIKPRELAGNISNFVNLTRFFFCLTKMTLIQVLLYTKDDISRLSPWPNKQKGPYKLECKGKFMSGYLKTKPLLCLLNLKYYLLIQISF